MKKITNEILLKDYIYYLIKVLNITSIVIELDNILILFNLLFIEESHNFKSFASKLKFFLKAFRQIKILFKTKKERILFNKIYKTLIFLNKNSNLNESLNLSLEDLHSKNLFLDLPYNLKIVYILKQKENAKIKYDN
jgi:hypothetical protein